MNSTKLLNINPVHNGVVDIVTHFIMRSSHWIRMRWLRLEWSGSDCYSVSCGYDSGLSTPFPLPLTRTGSPDGCHLTMLNIIVLGIPKVSAMSLKEVSGWQEPQTLFLLFSYHETSLVHLQRLSWYGKSSQLVFFLDYCILLRFQLIHSQPLSWSTRATPARSWQQSLRWAWRKVRERTPGKLHGVI